MKSNIRLVAEEVFWNEVALADDYDDTWVQFSHRGRAFDLHSHQEYEDGIIRVVVYPCYMVDGHWDTDTSKSVASFHVSNELLRSYRNRDMWLQYALLAILITIILTVGIKLVDYSVKFW